MTVIESGTVLITGPTRGMGRALTLEMAGRPAPHRPDLLLVGRPGQALAEVAAAARAAGTTAREIPCDLSRLEDVRAAAAAARGLVAAGTSPGSRPGLSSSYRSAAAFSTAFICSRR